MFLLIALMPMSLYLAVSISADSLNTALSLFTICLFLNLIFKEDVINEKDMVLVSMSILGLALSKQIYALLGLMFFIIFAFNFSCNHLICNNVNKSNWIIIFRNKSFMF
jgi:uncharacterized membrane protein